MNHRVSRAAAARTDSGAALPIAAFAGLMRRPPAPRLPSLPLHAPLWSAPFAYRTHYSPMTQADPILAVDNLTVRFQTHDGMVEAVRGVSLSVGRGECLGVVGESGSGKSQTFMTVMGLLAENGRASGSARFKGQDLLGLKAAALNRLRGSKMTMI